MTDPDRMPPWVFGPGHFADFFMSLQRTEASLSNYTGVLPHFNSMSDERRALIINHIFNRLDGFEVGHYGAPA